MYSLTKFYPPYVDVQKFWEDRYARKPFAKHSSVEYQEQKFWPLLRRFLTHEGQYLDAGCGIGGWILFLRDEGFKVEGIEIATSAVRALTEYDPDIRVKIASITEIPYADNSFDGVLAIGTLEYVERDLAKALTEVHRVLKKDGIFFIEVPLLNTLRTWVYVPLKRVEFWLKTWWGQKSYFAFHLFTPDKTKKMLEQHGFMVEAIQPHELPGDDIHYGLWVDWPFLRSREAYRLNVLGRMIKRICEAISPWFASTGMVIVARKR